MFIYVIYEENEKKKDEECDCNIYIDCITKFNVYSIDFLPFSFICTIEFIRRIYIYRLVKEHHVNNVLQFIIFL
jgi:hypothetical protein